MPFPPSNLVEIEKRGRNQALWSLGWSTWHIDWERLRNRGFFYLEKVIRGYLIAVLHYLKVVGGVYRRQSPSLPSKERQVTYRHAFSYLKSTFLISATINCLTDSKTVYL